MVELDWKFVLISVVAVFSFQAIDAKNGFPSLALAPLAAGPQPSATVCDGIDCQKGTCVTTSNALYPYECKCEQGWRNILNETSLGCGIPDCHLNASCSGTSLTPLFTPGPAALNLSTVCLLPLCGDGDCILTNTSRSRLPSYKCDCHEGSVNLLNSSSSICVSECNIGSDCTSLGIAPLFPTPPPLIPAAPGNYSGGCSGINCQNGNCISDPFHLLPYLCQCDDGWKNLLDLPYLPCGIPDCDYQHTCPNSSVLRPPQPAVPSGLTPISPPFNSNNTLLSICSTSICGDGDCFLTNTQSLLPSYICQCHQNAFKLFNSPSAICVQSCNLGANCSQVPGLTNLGSSSNSNSASGQEDRMILFGGLLVATTLWLSM